MTQQGAYIGNEQRLRHEERLYAVDAPALVERVPDLSGVIMQVRFGGDRAELAWHGALFGRWTDCADIPMGSLVIMREDGTVLAVPYTAGELFMDDTLNRVSRIRLRSVVSGGMKPRTEWRSHPIARVMPGCDKACGPVRGALGSLHRQVFEPPRAIQSWYAEAIMKGVV